MAAIQKGRKRARSAELTDDADLHKDPARRPVPQRRQNFVHFAEPGEVLFLAHQADPAPRRHHQRDVRPEETKIQHPKEAVEIKMQFAIPRFIKVMEAKPSVEFRSEAF